MIISVQFSIVLSYSFADYPIQFLNKKLQILVRRGERGWGGGRAERGLGSSNFFDVRK